MESHYPAPKWPTAPCNNKKVFLNSYPKAQVPGDEPAPLMVTHGLCK